MDLAQVKLPRFVLTIFLNALRIGNVHIGIKKKQKKNREKLYQRSVRRTQLKLRIKVTRPGFHLGF